MRKYVQLGVVSEARMRVRMEEDGEWRMEGELELFGQSFKYFEYFDQGRGFFSQSEAAIT